MAELLTTAVGAAGHELDLASTFRAYEGSGDQARQQALSREGEAEAARLSAAYLAAPPSARPQAWFTYHLYHKAPDWLGPVVSQTLGIPYLVAEASHAPKQAAGPWADGYAAAARAIGAADTVLCMTTVDRECVAPLLKPEARLFVLPPFLDHEPFARAAARRPAARKALAEALGLDEDRRWLLSVAMMRDGDKLASYRKLGASLASLESEDWQLVVVGDGAARREVEEALKPLGADRVAFMGRRPGQALPDIYAACDIYIWPAVGEAYGMALLEAQASGLPVVAGRYGGVPEVVRDGVTGLLAAQDDGAELTHLVRRLLDDEALRARLARAAAAFVARERSIDGAARVLDHALRSAPGDGKGEGEGARIAV